MYSMSSLWFQELIEFYGTRKLYMYTNDVYSGDRYCGNDGFSGPNPPDHAILFTVSGITAIADKKIGDFKFFFEILVKSNIFFDAQLSKSRNPLS